MGQIDSSTSLITSAKGIFAGIRSVSEDYLQTVSYFRGVAPNLRLSAETGVGAPVEWDGGENFATTTVDTAFPSTLEYVGYALEVRIPKWRAQESRQLVANAAAKLASETKTLKRSIAELKFAGIFAGTSMPGAKPVCSTTHPTLTGTRSNLGTSALDATALAAAVAAFRSWKTYEGTRSDRSQAPKVLVVGLSLVETARALVMNAQVAPSATNAQTPTLSNIYNVTRVVYNFEMDATDWALVLEDEMGAMAEESMDDVTGRLVSPVVVWDRQPEEYTAGIDDHNGASWVAVSFAMAAGFGPVPENIYGSNVG